MSRTQAKIFSIRGILKISRVSNLVIIGFTQFLTAVFLIGDPANWKAFIFDLGLALTIISTLFISSAGYIINDYYDLKIDLINRPDKVVVGTNLKRRAAMFYHVLFNFIGIFLGILAWWKIGAIHVSTSFLLWLYSNSLKRMPLVGNLLIGFLTGISILIIGVLYHDVNALILSYSLFAASIMVIREMIKDMEDMKGEKKHGIRSLPLLLGIRKTKHILYIICAVSAFALVLFLVNVNNSIVELYFMGLIPFIIYFIYRLSKADTVKHFKYLKYYCNLIILSGILSMIFH